MDWKTRIKNKMFWLALIPALLLRTSEAKRANTTKHSSAKTMSAKNLTTRCRSACARFCATLLWRPTEDVLSSKDIVRYRIKKLPSEITSLTTI